jgi:hypothetical protein
MGFANRAFVAAGVGFAAAAIVGCGSSGGSLLSASQSNQLSEQLNRVSAALSDADCSQARIDLSEFQSTVDSLGGVNATLISNLNQGASTIQSLASQDCQTLAPTKTTAKKTPPKTTTETQTQTQTTSTFTVPSTTTTYTAPNYTTTTYSTPATTSDTTTQAQTTTTSVNTMTSSSGGNGLGGGTTDTTDTTDTAPGSNTTTTSSDTTDTTGGGF